MVCLPKKHTGPIPKNPLATEVVFKAHPLQSIVSVSDEPGDVIAHPNGSTFVTIFVQDWEDNAHEVTVVVASAVGTGVAHSLDKSAWWRSISM